MSSTSAENKNQSQRFQGKRVIVTGASAGIGRATAIAFAAQGATVAVLARRKEILDELVKNELGGKGFAVTADFNDLARVTAAIQEAARLLGGVDVLVNNVGGIDFSWLSLPYPEQLGRTMKFNLETIEFATEAALPSLLESRGSIVNVGSLVGQLPSLSLQAYSVSKAAVHHSSKLRALVLARKGVNVNVVAPGLVETDIFGPMGAEAAESFKKRSAGLSPDGRNATSEDIAASILFLSDKQASGHITGQVLPVDGGNNIDLVFNVPDALAFNRNY